VLFSAHSTRTVCKVTCSSVIFNAPRMAGSAVATIPHILGRHSQIAVSAPWTPCMGVPGRGWGLTGLMLIASDAFEDGFNVAALSHPMLRPILQIFSSILILYLHHPSVPVTETRQMIHQSHVPSGHAVRKTLKSMSIVVIMLMATPPCVIQHLDFGGHLWGGPQL
jgi:hypothetical protein